MHSFENIAMQPFWINHADCNDAEKLIHKTSVEKKTYASSDETLSNINIKSENESLSHSNVKDIRCISEIKGFCTNKIECPESKKIYYRKFWCNREECDNAEILLNQAKLEKKKIYASFLQREKFWANKLECDDAETVYHKNTMNQNDKHKELELKNQEPIINLMQLAPADLENSSHNALKDFLHNTIRNESFWQNKIECNDAEQLVLRIHEGMKLSTNMTNIPVEHCKSELKLPNKTNPPNCLFSTTKEESLSRNLNVKLSNNSRMNESSSKGLENGLEDNQTHKISAKLLHNDKFWISKIEYDEAERQYYIHRARYEQMANLSQVNAKSFHGQNNVNFDLPKKEIVGRIDEKSNAIEIPINHSKENFWRNKLECEEAELLYSKFLKNEDVKSNTTVASEKGVEYQLLNTKNTNTSHSATITDKHLSESSDLFYSSAFYVENISQETFWLNKSECHDAEKQLYLKASRDILNSSLQQAKCLSNDIKSVPESCINGSFAKPSCNAMKNELKSEDITAEVIGFCSNKMLLVHNIRKETVWKNKAECDEAEVQLALGLMKTNAAECNNPTRMEEKSADDHRRNENGIFDGVEEKTSEAEIERGVTDKKPDDVDFNSEAELKITKPMKSSNTAAEIDEIKTIPDEEESYTEISEDGWEDILGSGRLKKRIIKEGKKGLASEGLGRPSRNDNVTISFKGYFQETLFEEIKELQFVAAEAEVIQAVDLCVVLMNTGEIAEIMADPEMAYGSLGLKPHVPSNAAVRLEVELLSHSPPTTPMDIPIEQRCAIGNRKRTRGNFWYTRHDYTSAIQCYRKAGEFLDDEKIELDAPIDRYQLPQNLQDLLEDRLKSYNNLAMAQMKIKAWDSALAALKQVLRHEPNNEKALYRKSKVLLEKYRTEEALGILRRICRLYPDNTSAKSDLARVSTKQKKGRENEERMSKKMLGLDKYEAEKAREKWYTKYIGNGLFSTKNAAIGISAIIFAAAGTAAYYVNSSS